MVREIFGIFGIFGLARELGHRWSEKSSESLESLDLLGNWSIDGLRRVWPYGELALGWAPLA